MYYISPGTYLANMQKIAKFPFNRVDSSLECLNQVNHNYWLWQPIPVRYRTREKQFLSLLTITRRDNER